MTDQQAIDIAEAYLRQRGVEFVLPGTVRRRPSLPGQIEVAFLVPEALDPNVVVDPPDERVRVDEDTGAAELVFQM